MQSEEPPPWPISLVYGLCQHHNSNVLLSLSAPSAPSQLPQIPAAFPSAPTFSTEGSVPLTAAAAHFQQQPPPSPSAFPFPKALKNTVSHTEPHCKQCSSTAVSCFVPQHLNLPIFRSLRWCFGRAALWNSKVLFPSHPGQHRNPLGAAGLSLPPQCELPPLFLLFLPIIYLSKTPSTSCGLLQDQSLGNKQALSLDQLSQDPCCKLQPIYFSAEDLSQLPSKLYVCTCSVTPRTSFS